jgi:hypothetical protein
MKSKLILATFFSTLILNAYAAPNFSNGEIFGTLFGALMLLISGILFINSILQRFLLDYKKYYNKVYWYSLFVLLSLIILKINDASDDPGDVLANLPIKIAFVVLVCIINFLIGNRSLYSSSDKENTDS